MQEDLPKMLYDETAPDGDDFEDVDVDLSEEDFDFAEFVAGILPTRKRVRIYPNGHLLAQAEELLERIEATDSEKDAEPLLAEYERLSRAMRKSLTVVVEGRSTERLKAIENEAYQAGVPNPAKIAAKLAKSKLPDGHHRREQMQAEAERGIQDVLLWQMADQIVHPTQGVTVEALQALRANAEPELDRIYRACKAANTQGVEGLTPDFSPGRSGPRPAG